MSSSTTENICRAQDIIIITGLSGAGKSLAIQCLEDLDYYCVDNMPPALLPQFSELCLHSQGKISRLAVVMDIRGGYFMQDLSGVISKIRQLDVCPRLIFLEASEEVLLRRFKTTRRRHPLTTRHRTLLESIRMERRQMQEIRALADKIIDTSQTDAKALKHELSTLFSTGAESGQLVINVYSFGFKYGVPLDADLVFDVRFLRNPYYDTELRQLNGNNSAIEEYVMADPAAAEYLEKLSDMLLFTLPRYGDEGKSYLTVGIGCTGGHHRSVVFARLLADRLRENNYLVVLDHRDIDKN